MKFPRMDRLVEEYYARLEAADAAEKTGDHE